MHNLYSNTFAISALLIATASITGCASTTAPIQVDTKPVQLTIIQPAPPAPVSLSEVTVSVVTAETLDAFITRAKAEQGTDNPVFVVVSVKGYENLSLNIAELKRYILQQQQIIAYYRQATAQK
jgi:type IV pilus biogenesis protein CpaD/CtpE